MITVSSLNKDICRHIILKSGPLIAATRPLVWNKTLKRYVEGRLTGSVENYDGRITKFSTEERAKKVVDAERARWHYYKSFSDRFAPDEWP